MFRPEKRERNNPLLDDEPSITRKRNVELHPGYGEYCVLWRDFMDIIPGMSWKNKPDKTQIPWIRILIERANITKNSLEDLKTERENKIKELDKINAPSKDATKEEEKERESLLQRIEEIDSVLLNPMFEKYRDEEKKKNMLEEIEKANAELKTKKTTKEANALNQTNLRQKVEVIEAEEEKNRTAQQKTDLIKYKTDLNKAEADGIQLDGEIAAQTKKISETTREAKNDAYIYTAYIKELEETEKSLVRAWNEMESIIKKLSENAYVKNKGKVEEYKNALYDMIHP